ncbi:MAG TPA: cupin domain-containing protein [Bryobacteraceae bacterium]|nr:cupin domain-containing protein [Bryobacteraceae bacterium]
MSDPATASAASKSELKHIRWEDVPIETVNPLFDRQLVVGDQIMIARVLLKKGSVVPMHSHFNEQISHAQSGALQFTIDGREILLRAGEFLCIPPHMPHSALALEDFVGIDIFTPPRADWLAKTDQYLRG